MTEFSMLCNQCRAKQQQAGSMLLVSFVQSAPLCGQLGKRASATLAWKLLVMMIEPSMLCTDVCRAQRQQASDSRRHETCLPFNHA